MLPIFILHLNFIRWQLELELELLRDIDILLMIEKGIRDRIFPKVLKHL